MTSTIISIFIIFAIYGFAWKAEQHKKSKRLKGRNKKGQYKTQSKLKKKSATKSYRTIPVYDGDRIARTFRLEA